MSSPILDYQPPNNARRNAVGGLTLLGIFTTAIPGTLFLLLNHYYRPTNWPIEYFILLGICATGITKLLLARFIAIRNQPAAWTALTFITLEVTAMAALGFLNIPIHSGDLFGALCVAVPFATAWLAVAVEILRTLITKG